MDALNAVGASKRLNGYMLSVMGQEAAGEEGEEKEEEMGDDETIEAEHWATSAMP